VAGVVRRWERLARCISESTLTIRPPGTLHLKASRAGISYKTEPPAISSSSFDDGHDEKRG
jgi:hypothetical protein